MRRGTGTGQRTSLGEGDARPAAVKCFDHILVLVLAALKTGAYGRPLHLFLLPLALAVRLPRHGVDRT
jgi:hypothetical protein